MTRIQLQLLQYALYHKKQFIFLKDDMLGGDKQIYDVRQKCRSRLAMCVARATTCGKCASLGTVHRN